MPSFKKIYFGDYTEEGYDTGFNDSKKHQPKNRFKFFKATHPVNWIWNFDNAWETFQRNYDKGYINNEQVEHNVYYKNNITQKGANTMTVNNYAAQLAILNQFEKDLQSLKQCLSTLNTNYKQQMNSLKGMGFMVDYTNTLQTRYVTFDGKISDMLTMIDKHLQTIADHKDEIEKNLQQARG